MIEPVINQLATEIANTGIVSRSGNVAEEIAIRQSDSSTRRIPAAHVAPFKTGDLLPIVPDDRESAISWWEVGATQVRRQSEYTMQLQNDCRLLMWLNTSRLSPGDAATAQRAIVNAVLTSSYPIEDGDPIRGVIIDYAGQVFDEQLSKFGWDNPEFQVSMPPYKLAAHRFTITYTVSKNCAPQITTKSKSC